MSTNINDYVDQMEVTERMAQFSLDNFDLITEFPIEDKLLYIAQIQSMMKTLEAVEKRLRPEILDVYDCPVGKSKTKTEKVMGFKIVTKRPVNDKVDKDEISRVMSELGDRFEDLFRTSFSVVGDEFKDAGVDEQAIVRSAIISKEGLPAVGVIKIVDK